MPRMSVFAAMIIPTALALLSARCNAPQTQDASAVSTDLAHAREAVQRRLSQDCQLLHAQMQGLASQIPQEREFTMKLLVENDRTAPEVTDLAPRYRAAMGLSLLDIADSAGTLLSSGHFPANAGSSVSVKLANVGEEPVFVHDTVNGRAVLTLQSRAGCAVEGVHFSCVGGWIVDETYLARLAPWTGVTVIVRQETGVLGMSGVSSMSELLNNSIVLNNRTFAADTVAIPFAGAGPAPQLLVLIEQPTPR